MADNGTVAAAAELDNIREISESIRQQTAQAKFKVTSKNKMLTVTVGGQGDLQAIAFRGEAYRSLAPAELASLIVDTVEKARKRSLAQALESMSRLSPQTALPMDLMDPATTMDDFMDHLLDVAGQYMPDADLDGIPRGQIPDGKEPT